MLRRDARYVFTALLLVFVSVFSPLYASSTALAKGPKVGLQSNVSISIQNAYLKLVASNRGRFALGTTGGDPESVLDDNKRLLFGYPTDVGTSFTTVRIGNGSTTTDYRLGASDWNSSGIAPIAPPITDSTSITTIYEQDGVRVEEKLMFAYNESTERQDTTNIQYTVTNNSGAYRTVGLRVLLDIMVGNNDGAPYFVDGLGYVTRQSDWRGADVPNYWVSYESPIFATTQLRSRGQLRGGDAVAPDRFVIADWAEATQTTWEYAVNPQELVTSDSATILYYNPVRIEPGPEQGGAHVLRHHPRRRRIDGAVDRTGSDARNPKPLQQCASDRKPHHVCARTYAEHVGHHSRCHGATRRQP